jgi:hypothetical protein
MKGFYERHKDEIAIIVGSLLLTLWSYHLGIDVQGIGEFLGAWLLFSAPAAAFYFWAQSNKD